MTGLLDSNFEISRRKILIVVIDNQKENIKHLNNNSYIKDYLKYLAIKIDEDDSKKLDMYAKLINDFIESTKFYLAANVQLAKALESCINKYGFDTNTELFEEEFLDDLSNTKNISLRNYNSNIKLLKQIYFKERNNDIY
jgi:hypothetical protein